MDRYVPQESGTIFNTSGLIRFACIVLCILVKRWGIPPTPLGFEDTLGPGACGVEKRVE